MRAHAVTPSSHAVTLNGVEAEVEASAALWLRSTATLVVADLHLEKASAFAARGQPLPPYDTADTLARLSAVIARRAPGRVVCLGDSFHDRLSSARMSAVDTARLTALVTQVPEWIWIAGNHDPNPVGAWGGQVVAEYRLAGLLFRHEAVVATQPGEISGHYHPKARIDLGPRRLSARCFVTDGRRLILPAFGTFTGGLDVLDPAISHLFPEGFVAYLAVRDRIVPAARRRLLPIA